MDETYFWTVEQNMDNRRNTGPGTSPPEHSLSPPPAPWPIIPFLDCRLPLLSSSSPLFTLSKAQTLPCELVQMGLLVQGHGPAISLYHYCLQPLVLDETYIAERLGVVAADIGMGRSGTNRLISVSLAQASSSVGHRAIPGPWSLCPSPSSNQALDHTS